MTAPTFFLNPDNERDVGSPAFRQRYCERRKIKTLPQSLPSLTPLILSVVLPLGMAYLFLTQPPEAPPPGVEPPFGQSAEQLRSKDRMKKVFGGLICAASGVMLLVTISAILAARRNYRLAWEGKIVPGRIETCNGTEYLPVSEDNPLLSKPYTRVEVAYSFESPSGRRVRGATWRDCWDLRQEQLPPPGTPVCVLVLDERKYELL